MNSWPFPNFPIYQKSFIKTSRNQKLGAENPRHEGVFLLIWQITLAPQLIRVAANAAIYIFWNRKVCFAPKSFIFVDLQKIIFVRHFWCCSGNNATQGLLRSRNPTCSCFFHSCFQSFHLNSKPSTKPRRKEESHPNRDMILSQLLHHKECNIKFSAMAFVGFVQIVAAKPRQKAVCIRINDRQRNSQWGGAFP